MFLEFIFSFLCLASSEDDIGEQAEVKKEEAVKESITSSENVYFYMFPVGQGNCQLVMYHDQGKKIGILYDAGSSSSQVHPKLASTMFPVPFLDFSSAPLKLKQGGDSDDDILGGGDDDVLFSTSSGKRTPKEEGTQVRLSHGTPFSNQKSTKSEEAVIKDIEEKLQNLKLNYLVVFLSHPDSDHINFFPKIKLPDGLKAFVFFCGNMDSKSKQHDGEEINEVLKYCLQNSQSVHFALPFYWGEGYKAMKSQLAQESNKFKFLRKQKGATQPFLRLDLKSLFIKAKEMEDFSFEESSVLGLTTAFSDTHIWILNYDDPDESNDIRVNNQSVVVSCTMNIKSSNASPIKRLSFVLTGDAHEEVFNTISSRLGDNDNTNVLQANDAHRVVLVLPHHGAKGNYSKTMLKLFQPSVFLISAGNGKQHGHPHLATYEELHKYYDKRGNASPNERDALWVQDRAEVAKVMFFKQRGATVTGRAQHTALPIFCTNLCGQIQVTDHGFEKFYSPIIQYKRDKYILAHAQHIGTVQWDKTTQFDPADIQWKKDQKLDFLQARIKLGLDEKYNLVPFGDNTEGLFFDNGLEIIELIDMQPEQANGVKEYYIYRCDPLLPDGTVEAEYDEEE